MATYLLTWNPNKTPVPKSEWGKWVRAVRNGKPPDFDWSTGRTQRIKPGDRLFLLRQGPEPRGIVASGTATSGCTQQEHWENPRQKAWYVDLEIDSMVDQDDPLPRKALNVGKLRNVWWNTQSSGISIADEAAAELERKWSKYLLRLSPTKGAKRESQRRRTSSLN